MERKRKAAEGLVEDELINKATRIAVIEKETHFGRKLSDALVGGEKEAPALTNVEIEILQSASEEKIRKI